MAAKAHLPFPANSLLGTAYVFWESECVGAGPPLATSIDPLRIPTELLPNVVWAEFLSPSGRMRLRLLGEEVVERFGRGLRGRSTAEILSGKYREFIESCFATAHQRRRPVYVESAFRGNAAGAPLTQRLIMPFVAREDGDVTQSLTVQIWPGTIAPMDTAPFVQVV